MAKKPTTKPTKLEKTLRKFAKDILVLANVTVEHSHRLRDLEFHSPSGSVDRKLDQLLTLVTSQGDRIMSKLAELESELVSANEATNEIASDLDDLIGRLSGGLSPEEAENVKGQITALKERLQTVASKHTA